MKFPNRLSFSLLAGSLLAFAWQACTPANIDPDNIVWEPEFLGPVAYTLIDPVEIANAISDTSDYDSEAADLQIPNFQYDQPINTGPVGPVDLPEEFDETFDIFDEVTAGSATVSVWFENTWPIAVGAGSRLVASDSMQGTLFEIVLQQDVAPGELFIEEVQLTNQTVEFGLTFQWEDFQSPGGNNVTFQSGNDLVVYYTFKVEELTIALAKPQQEYILEDESTFEFDIEGDIDSASEITGTFSFFLENNLPATIELELKLLDANRDTIYSFFNAQAITLQSPNIDGNGFTMTPVELDLIDAVDIDDIKNLNNATFLYTRTRFITPTDPLLVVNNDNYIRIQLTADVKLKVQ